MGHSPLQGDFIGEVFTCGRRVAARRCRLVVNGRMGSPCAGHRLTAAACGARRPGAVPMGQLYSRSSLYWLC